MKGLQTTFELLPVLSGFPVIKPEVENFGGNFVFFILGIFTLGINRIVTELIFVKYGTESLEKGL